MKKFLSLIYFILYFSSLYGFSLDERLSLIIKNYDLQPLNCKKPKDSSLGKIGEFFFNNNFLSGDESVSCKTCHLQEHNLTDGNSLPIGVGGEGFGQDRIKSKGVLVKRNVITLFGRGDNSYINFFWEGRVELGDDGFIYSPFGEYLPKGFNNALAVASAMPLVERDEFVGGGTMNSGNILSEKLDDKYYEESLEAFNQMIPRLFKRLSEEELSEFKSLLSGYNKTMSISNLKIWDIGNALSEFIKTKFPCKQNKWEKYMKGAKDILTNEEKKGAILFYGKGKCAACHSGSFYTNFKHSSIALPQSRYGPTIFNKDFGRNRVTNLFDDKYLFRVPSLRSVSKTSPYGHNGIFPTIKSIIKHHLNPIPYLNKSLENSPEMFFKQGEIIKSRSPILGFESITSDGEINNIVTFLKTL